jgi:hypothetical protein
MKMKGKLNEKNEQVENIDESKLKSVCFPKEQA